MFDDPRWGDARATATMTHASGIAAIVMMNGINLDTGRISATVTAIVMTTRGN
jgi:hypothetical protein